jgi:hypothetical protein
MDPSSLGALAVLAAQAEHLHSPLTGSIIRKAFYVNASYKGRQITEMSSERPWHTILCPENWRNAFTQWEITFCHFLKVQKQILLKMFFTKRGFLYSCVRLDRVQEDSRIQSPLCMGSREQGQVFSTRIWSNFWKSFVCLVSPSVCLVNFFIRISFGRDGSLNKSPNSRRQGKSNSQLGLLKFFSEM